MSVRGQGLCISVIQGEMKVSGIENLAQCKCGSYATHIIVSFRAQDHIISVRSSSLALRT